MQSPKELLRQKREAIYLKLKNRFFKNLKSGQFGHKTNRQKKHLLSQLLRLESQLGLSSSPQLKHWALALTLGIVCLQGHAQQHTFPPSKKSTPTGQITSPAANLRTSPAPGNQANVDFLTAQELLGDQAIFDKEGTTGDMNGDGNVDIIGFSYSDAVKIYHNDGSGNFGNPIEIESLATDPEYVISGDFDDDGDMDLLVVHSYYESTLGRYVSSTEIFTNGGDESFTSALQSFGELRFGAQPKLTDLDNDGDLDLVASYYGVQYAAYLGTFFNDGSGYFSAGDTLPYKSSALVGDFDSDGDTDIAGSSNYLYIFTNDGSGHFDSNSYIRGNNQIYFYEAIVTDLNDDGFLDIVYDYYYNGLNVLYNDGSAQFTLENILTPVSDQSSSTYYYLVDIADMDADGDLDIVYQQRYTSFTTYDSQVSMGILTNSASAFTPTILDISLIDDNILLMDADNDDDTDIVSASTINLASYLNDGNFQFTEVQSDLNVVYGIPYLIDMDGDQDLDAIVSYSAMVLKNDGTGTFSIFQNLGKEEHFNGIRFTAADFDGDGDNDVVFAAPNIAEISLWSNDGTGQLTQSTPLTLPVNDDLYIVTHADIDLDGDQDLIVYGNNNQILTLANDGSGNFTIDQYLEVSSYSVTQITPEDLDNDGDADLIISGTYGLSVLINDAGIFGSASNYPATASANIACFGLIDLNADSFADIVAFSGDGEGTPGTNYVLTNDTNGAFTLDTLALDNQLYPNAVLIEDFDLDGDLDIYLSGEYHVQDELWSNDSGTFSYLGSTGINSYRSALGDIDGDGDPDLLALDWFLGNRFILNTTNEPVFNNTITSGDSLVLVTLYDSLGGAGWTDQSNWLTGKADTWFGVTINADKRVSGLGLPNNNLDGILPEALGNLSALTTLDLKTNALQGNAPVSLSKLTLLQSLDLADNELTSFPNVSGISSLITLDISGNALVFSDVTPNISISEFIYSPQAILSEAVHDTIPAGESYSLSVKDLGEGTVYQWYFGALIAGESENDVVSPIDTATVNPFIISAISVANQGTYQLVATHPDAPDLELTSDLFTILGKTDLQGNVWADESSLLTDGNLIIYRIKEGPFYAEDTVVISSSGTYAFNDLVLGDFILLAQPNRENFPNTIQTYYEEAEFYEDATTVEVRTELDNVDIYMLVYEDPEPEQTGATVSGVVETDFSEEEVIARLQAREAVKKAGCSMRRNVSSGKSEEDTYELYAYVESDDEGRFNFEGLPEGTYLLNIEYPGVPMDTESDVIFVIGANPNQQFEVVATVTEDKITVESQEIVLGVTGQTANSIRLYPNPVSDQVTLQYQIDRQAESLKLNIYTLSGALVVSSVLNGNTGTHQVRIDCSELKSGIYLLILTDESGDIRQSTKIIKR